MNKMLRAAIVVLVLSLITTAAAMGAQAERAEALLTLASAEVIAYVGDSGHIGMSNAAHPSILYRLLDDNPNNDNSLNGSSDELFTELEELEAIINSLNPEDYGDLETLSKTTTEYTFTERLEILNGKLNLIYEFIPDSGINNEKQEELVISKIDESVEVNFSLTIQLSPNCDFSDSRLEAVVRYELDLDPGIPILRKDAASIARLNASRYSIVELDGIECLANITRLDLLFNRIDDLGPLANLTTLDMLDVRFNQISELSPLANLIMLNELRLDGNQISDLSPIADLTKLTVLELSYNQISDLNPLSGMTQLDELELRNNHISDISPLTGMTSIRTLDLSLNQIDDIELINGMTGLEELRLGHNQISDVGALTGMTNLTSLRLNHNLIVNINDLAGLTNLDWLFLNNNAIVDISPLVGLTNLDRLYLEYNQVVDISSFKEWTGDFLDLWLCYNPLSKESRDLIPKLIKMGIFVREFC